MSAFVLLELKDVHTHIGAYHILHGVNLQVPRGELTLLLGRNGAGKTTTFRMCLGLSTADSGSISVFGMPMPQETLAIKARLGVVSQFDTLDPDFSCSENLMVYGRYFGMRSADIQSRIPSLLEFAASKERCALAEDARGGAIAESQSHEYGTHPTRCAE